MGRFLRIQIYNSSNTQIEYDNLTDTSWGIQAGSASLDTQIMDKELRFGNIYASMFQAIIFNLNADLKGRRIIVSADDISNTYIINSDGDYLVDSDANRLVYEKHEDAYNEIFVGTILSSKLDGIGTDRTLIAYDDFYYLRNTNISSFWNTYWENRTTSTLVHFRNALLTSIGLTYSSKTLVNDNLTIKNYYEGVNIDTISFGTMLKMVCELQNCCPHINEVGTVEFVTLDNINTHDITNSIEKRNSNWEEFTTNQITGVAIYTTTEDLAQVVGTDTNVYNIVNNIFLSGMTSTELTNVATPILTELSAIRFVPGTFKLILSEPSWRLGEQLVTDRGIAYIFKARFYNSVLIDEIISCNQSDADLNKDVQDYNDETLEGLKLASLSKTIDAFTIDYADFKQGVSTQFQQTADTIVMKVDTSGNIVEVKLGTDPDDSSATVFQVGADNISFIANDTIELTTNNLEINSTNFQVDSIGNLTCADATMTNADVRGKITADTGDIGGFTISEYGIEADYGSSGTTVYINSASQGEAFGNTITFGTSRRYQTGLNIGYNGIIANGWGNNSTSKNILTTVTGPGGGTWLQSHLLTVSGTKSRVVDTDDYGDRLLYCYETPTPMFGDIGEGTISDDGKCYVWLDPVFAQTIADTQYQVFLQKYGQGECWVSERTSNYFVVEGTQGLSFGWEIKAKQQGYEQLRLDKEAWIQNEAFNHVPLDTLADAHMNSLEIVDYGELAENHIAEIQSEREVV